MSQKVCIDVPGMPGTGPYSHAVRAGDLLFVSGQSGMDPASGKAAPDFPTQARQVFANLETVLKAGGCTFADVVNTTVNITDLANFPVVNQLFAEFFPTEPPARMTMNVPLPFGLMLSIGCVAAIPTD